MDAGTIETAAQTAAGVTTQAANGNVWSFSVFAVLVIASLIALWIWRSTSQPKPDGGDGGEPCTAPPEGCPAIQLLVGRVDLLAKQLEEDREERRQHRTDISAAMRDIHGRIDLILLSGKAAVR